MVRNTFLFFLLFVAAGCSQGVNMRSMGVEVSSGGVGTGPTPGSDDDSPADDDITEGDDDDGPSGNMGNNGPNNTNPNNPNPNAPNNGSDGDNDSGGNVAGDQRECAARIPGSQSVIIAGNQRNQTINVQFGRVTLIRVVGNQNHVTIRLNGPMPEGSSMPGVCLFIAGNQGSADVVVNGASISHFYFKARGNEASASVDVTAGSIARISADFAGNHASLDVDGVGAAVCSGASIRQHGHGWSFNCQ